MRYRMYPGQDLVLEFPNDNDIIVEYADDRVTVWCKDQMIFLLVFNRDELLSHSEQHNDAQ